MVRLESDTAGQQLLVVHESGRRWVDVLRSAFAGAARIETRHSVHADDTLASLRGRRFATLLLELGQPPLESLELLQRVHELACDTAPIVVARSDQEDLELFAREFGARAFLREPLTLNWPGPSPASFLGCKGD
jgi:DNA-binding response OmpR family regulator